MFKYGPITNNQTGESMDIEVIPSPNFIRDLLISGGIILIGVAYLAISQFRNGADTYDASEFRTLKKLGLIHDEEVGDRTKEFKID